MNFKKCNRCGCFFTSENETVCVNCAPVDKSDISKLKNYFEENASNNNNLTDISINTGITTRNLNRYLNTNEFPDINIKF